VNLGISTDAPQSTEALEIINDDLRDDILSWEEELAEQLKYFGVTLWMYENGVGILDDNLKEIALLRLENPDIPLSELGKILKEPIGKSGANYRLKKIVEIASEI
jgi:DNA-binding transcriptional regulator WhiA